MTALLDVNLLIALAWPNHVHHEIALDWFGRRARSPWATCAATQFGFIRVSSSPAFEKDARSPEEARAHLLRIVALPGHRFWADIVDLANFEALDWSKVHGHRQVSDAHLLAVAMANGGRLATLDRSIRSLSPPGKDPNRLVECVLG